MTEKPTLREAIRSDAAINLYCGCKWAVWNISWLVISLLSLGALLVYIPAMLLWRGGIWTGNRIADFFEAAGRKIAPHLNERQREAVDKLNAVHYQSRQTPVARRIYGYCPVDIEKTPSWADKIGEIVGSLRDRVSPPTEVWVCRNCGNIYGERYSEPITCDCRLSETRDYVEVPEDEAEEISKGV